MTTEKEARGLLAKAAASIDVDDAVPVGLAELREPGPRRWPVLAAAAAVVLAVSGGVAVAQQLGGDDATTTNLPDRTSAVDQPTNQPSLPGDDDRLPSLIGYTEDEAIELLQERGHPVEVHVVPDGCDVAGIVTGTSPPAGTPVSPSQPVTIRVVGQQTVIDCVGEVPMDVVWEVVRAAQGIGDPVPAVTDAVLSQLAGELAGTSAGSPRLLARWAFDGSACDGGTAAAWDLRIWVATGPDASGCPATSFLIAFDGRDIKSVAADYRAAPDDDPPTLTNAREESAEWFVAWARGEGPAPKFAARVRLVGSGFHPAWLDEPENRTTYAGCSGLGFPDCGIDPVAAIYHAEGRIRALDGAACASGRGLPRWLADAAADQVRLALPTDTGCDALVVLWIDPDGVIYGVSQVGAPPR